tara:strand:+ start:71 stop:556 length:486 start_codon:yes stop_codon:yes gene_type:complete
MSEVDWDLVAKPSFMTVRQMITICLVLEIIVSTIFVGIAQRFDIHSSEFLWWALQFFGLVVSTNVGAVILAIMAQRSASVVGEAYEKAFTPDFYKTLYSLSMFRLFVEEEGKKEGKDLEEELNDVAIKLYRVMRAQLDVKANDITSKEPLNEVATDDELFS